MQYPNQTSRNAGFSLVEISIVLAIMGLVVGGVLGGAVMKRNLQIKTVMDETSRLVESITKFKQIYGGWPGDLWNATDKFGETDPQGSVIYNGNGDGQITGSPDNGGETSEQGRMMHQLALAGLIEGEYDGAGTRWEVLNMIYGPIDKNSVFSIKGEGTVADPLRVQFFGVLDADVSGTLDAVDGTYRGVLTPRELQNIDTKYDDGQPLTGKIRGQDGLGIVGSCINAGAYVLTNNWESCYMEVIIESQF